MESTILVHSVETVNLFNLDDIQDLKDISHCLLATLDSKTQKQAESQLTAYEHSITNFPVKLLSLTSPETISKADLSRNVSMPAVLCLKNLIKKYWEDLESSLFNPSVRATIKRDIFNYIAVAENSIRNQLSEVICIISEYDFPQDWPDLLDHLLAKMSSSDFSSNLVVLKTCHKIFKRYRLEERSDDLYREINFVMEKFGPFLLQIFVGIESILKSGVSDKNLLGIVIQNATYANKIFYSLSFQDIPAFFEDNLVTFMNILMFFFNFQSPVLVTEDEDQPGIIEKFASSVAKIVILYSSKYEEDFTMLGDFAQATWNILTSRVSLLPKDDKLTYTCISFLASVSKQERHKTIFQGSLKIICESIIIPNMRIRESDLEVFEDEPMEFIKRDSEGGHDLSHRHGSAVALIHGLMSFHANEMTQILCETVTRCLTEYSSNPSKNWASKLLATQVFSAVGARGFADSVGVTSVNPLINIVDYFNAQVMPDLKSNSGNLHPLLLLEAIKFVVSYRNQLSKNDLVQCMPLLLSHLESDNFIIHTFSAIAVEKILSIKRGGEELFTSADISAIVGKLSISILALIFNQNTIEKMCENQFLIKAFVRVLGLAQASDINAISLKFSDRIIWLLSEIIKNPINPQFTHYFFESLALMIRSSSSFPETFGVLETKIVPHLYNILQSDQSDLFPYSFQILAVIVESNHRTEIPDYVKSLIPVVLQPTLWSISCNVPGLVRFLQACFAKNPELFSSPQVVESLISIFRILLNSKLNDIHGFSLISALFGILPIDLIERYIRPVLVLILSRFQSHKTQKLSSQFLQLICFLVIETKVSFGAKFVIQSLDQIQQNIYVMLFKSLFIPIITRIQEPSDKKLVILGISELLMELQGLIQGSPDGSALWFSILGEILKLSVSKTSSSTDVFNADLIEDISTTQGSFNRLVSVPKYKKYSKLTTLPEPDLRILQLIKSLEHVPTFKDQLHSHLDVQSKAQLSFLLQKFNTSI